MQQNNYSLFEFVELESSDKTRTQHEAKHFPGLAHMHKKQIIIHLVGLYRVRCIASVMTPASDSCGAQGIRSVLSPSGYIGPSQPVIAGASSGSSQDDGGLLSPMQSVDETKQVLDNSDEPWSCLLVFRLAVGQQLNVSLIDFTAAARAEFSEARFEDGDDLNIRLQHHHQLDQHQQHQQHVDRLQKTSPNGRQVRHSQISGRFVRM